MKRIALLGLLALAGCFTISQTEFPVVQMTRPAKDVKIRLEGFQATVVDYTPVYATSTYMTDDTWFGGMHRRHPHGPMIGTYTTEMLMPTVRNTEVFRDRATRSFESAGFILRAAPAQYTVSVRFGGPLMPPDGSSKIAAWDLGTLFFTVYNTALYTADLRVYDIATGKAVFSQTYSQTFETHGWSPLSFLGTMSYDPADASYMQRWCLDALTDRICADATSFLASTVK